MKIHIPIYLFLTFIHCPFYASELNLQGTLASCFSSSDLGYQLSLKDVTYEMLDENPSLNQAIAQRYRQEGYLKLEIAKTDVNDTENLLLACNHLQNPFSLLTAQQYIVTARGTVDKDLKITALQSSVQEPVLNRNPAVRFDNPLTFVNSAMRSGANLLSLTSSLVFAGSEAHKAMPPNGNGYGSVTFDNGDSYTGYFKNYRFDGKGIYRWKNGNTHDGYYSANQRHGSGVWIVINQLRTVGTWVRDSLEGYGQTFYNNGQKYEGNFLNWYEHGHGKWTWPNGQYYEGSFQYGYFSGLGTMVLANGTKYVGNWVRSQRNGYGVSTYANGDVYAGSWTSDHYHGQGKYTGRDWWYEGNWVNSLRNGLGTMENATIRYEGLWEKDRIHGRGKLKDRKNEIIWETTWILGDLAREYSGVILTKEGHRFDGVFKELSPQNGVATFSNQDTYEGPFLNGKFHGRGRYTFSADGLTVEDEFKEDSCLLSLEDTLTRLNISMKEDTTPPPATILADGLFPEVSAAFSAEDTPDQKDRAAPAVVLVPFLKEVAAAMTVGYMRIHAPVRFMTFTKSIAAVVTKYRTGPGTGIIYYREDTKKYEPDLFLYVGKTINEANYNCRQKVHNRVYRRLHPAHVEFNFKEFETQINIFDPVFKLKEQAYIEQCEAATHPLCTPHGPNHLANKINAMGMRGFDEWKAANPVEWALIEATCGLAP
jgi:hypothetical protein